MATGVQLIGTCDAERIIFQIIELGVHFLFWKSKWVISSKIGSESRGGDKSEFPELFGIPWVLTPYLRHLRNLVSPHASLQPYWDIPVAPRCMDILILANECYPLVEDPSRVEHIEFIDLLLDIARISPERKEGKRASPWENTR